MTEVWTTFLFTVSMWMAVPRVRVAAPASFAALRRRCSALTTLSRPVFVLFPIALAGVGLVVFPLAGVKRRATALRSGSSCSPRSRAAMLPWFTYNYVDARPLHAVARRRRRPRPLGRIVAGDVVGPPAERADASGRRRSTIAPTLDRRVEAIAAREHLPAEPMLEYVHQWEDIRRIWTTPVDPFERAVARVEGRPGIPARRDREHPPRLDRRTWPNGWRAASSSCGPAKFRSATAKSTSCRRSSSASAGRSRPLLFLAALAGAVVLFRRGQVAPSLMLCAPILYITAVHFPLLTEARQSLPAQPVLLLLAAIGIASFINGTGRSLALEPQVHEREHL